MTPAKSVPITRSVSATGSTAYRLSIGLRAIACTRTTTSPGPAVGVGTEVSATNLVEGVRTRAFIAAGSDMADDVCVLLVA